MVMATLTAAIDATQLDGPGQGTVVYPNWGVAFHRLGGVDNGHSVWQHSLAIPFIKIDIPNIEIPRCSAINSTCTRLHHMAADTKLDTENIIRSIQDQINTVKSLIPVKYDVKRTRAKHAIFGFVSEFAKAVFGTPSESDLKHIQTHISRVEKTQKLQFNQIMRQNKELHSFVKITDERISNSMNIRNNRNLIEDLNEKLNKSITILYGNERNLEKQLKVMSYDIEVVTLALRFASSLTTNAICWN
jgi:hypothetical protein